MTETSRIEQLLLKDRLILSVAMVGIFMIAAIYTFFGVGMPMSVFEMTWGEMMPMNMSEDMGKSATMSSDSGMSGQGIGEMMMSPVWSLRYAILVFLMWWIMMIAMMLPSVASVILLYSALIRRGTDTSKAPQSAGFFLLGYLAAWAFFSLLATAMQWLCELRGIMSPMDMTLTSNLLGSSIMILAGIYQFTPWKESCLQHCQSPMQFLTEHRRPGLKGAFLMGVEHGAYCLGCCWFLMGLLFVGGIMNLFWILGLTVYVLLEKLLMNQVWNKFSKMMGIGLICFGFHLLLNDFV
tara:strand:- start:1192 stop:2076 length:885 start_codon:yes stop_codon:yes gene_type:complete